MRTLIGLVVVLCAGLVLAIAADHRAQAPAQPAEAPRTELAAYYADQLSKAPIESAAALRAAEGRAKLASWLAQRFAAGERLRLWVADISEADRRSGRYFLIATAGFGDREEGWTLSVPHGEGAVDLTGVSVVHLRETGRIGRRFLQDVRRGEGMVACNLHPDAVWSVEPGEAGQAPRIGISLGPNAPSRMHSVFQDCEPVSPESP